MELSEYNFVMARFDRDPALVFQAYFYEESPQSVGFESEDGRVGIAIGINSDFSRQRALIDGWVDVTDAVKGREDTADTATEISEEEPSEEPSEEPIEDVSSGGDTITIKAEKPKKKATKSRSKARKR